MMWQDFVFLVGSMTSVLFLYPTLRDTASAVPRETSIPSMLIGGAYSFTFLTLGMTFSAAGSFAACTMWSLIAAFRAPDPEARSPGRFSRAATRVSSRLTALVTDTSPQNDAPTPQSTEQQANPDADIAPHAD